MNDGLSDCNKINPTVLDWRSFVVSLAMCEPPSVPYSLGKSCQLEDGSAAEILMSTLAYGWVERCSDIVGCGTSFFQDKYSLGFYFHNCICFKNYYEHVECLNKLFCFYYMLIIYAYVYI